AARERRGADRRPSDGEPWQDKSRELRAVGRGCKYLSAGRFEQPATALREVCGTASIQEAAKIRALRGTAHTSRSCRLIERVRAMIAWSEPPAGPPQPRQGSRYARPAPPACGLDRHAPVRLFGRHAGMAYAEHALLGDHLFADHARRRPALLGTSAAFCCAAPRPGRSAPRRCGTFQMPSWSAIST